MAVTYRMLGVLEKFPKKGLSYGSWSLFEFDLLQSADTFTHENLMC